MRFRWSRCTGIIGLYLLFGLGLAACSSQQQEGDQLEVTQDDGQYADQGQQGEQGYDEYGQQGDDYGQEGGDQYGQEGGDQYGQEGGDQYGYGQEGGDTYAAAEGDDAYGGYGDATENDLEEIIQEMNSQAADGDLAMGEPLATDPIAAEPMPMGDPAAAGASGMAATSMDSTGVTAATSTTSAPFQPGGTPAAAGLPELGSKIAYIVQKGDTLAMISSKVYGVTNRWREMAELSGLDNPSRIYPGDVVYFTLDESAIPFAQAYETVTRSQEVVQAGDTLGTIAQRVYGDPNSWKSIWRQNDNINNPDVLTPGTSVYYLQAAALSAAVNKARDEFKSFANANDSKDSETTAAASDVQEEQKSADDEVIMIGSDSSFETGITLADVRQINDMQNMTWGGFLN